jgi:hypothetical protein
MTTDNVAELDRRVLEVLSGNEKLQILLGAEYDGSVSKWALDRKIHPNEVNHVLAGRRENAAIRELMAETIGATRQLIDELIADRKVPAGT